MPVTDILALALFGSAAVSFIGLGASVYWLLWETRNSPKLKGLTGTRTLKIMNAAAQGEWQSLRSAQLFRRFLVAAGASWVAFAVLVFYRVLKESLQ